MTLIRFGCAIRLPNEGNFVFRDLFNANPEQFLNDWISGAVGTIYTGPLLNKEDDHVGHLLIVPVVKVRFVPNHNHNPHHP